MNELRWVVERLVENGVRRIWIGGSFVTDDARPADVDLVYEPATDPRYWSGLLHPSQKRVLKQLKHIDLWRYPTKVTDRIPPMPIEEFFQFDRDGERKGIISLELGRGIDDQEPASSTRGEEPDPGSGGERSR